MLPKDKNRVRPPGRTLKIHRQLRIAICTTGRSPSETLCFSSYLLSFAAGAMLYVVVEELIPEMSQGQHSNVGTVFFAVGFSVMMVLDVALG